VTVPHAAVVAESYAATGMSDGAPVTADETRNRARALPPADRARFVAWVEGHGTRGHRLVRDNPWAAVLAGALRWEFAEDWGRDLVTRGVAPGTRVAAALVEVVRRSAVERGHTVVDVRYLPPMVAALLHHAIAPDACAASLHRLCEHGVLTFWEGTIALPSLARTEARIAARMAAHLRTTPAPSSAFGRAVRKRLLTSMLSESQRDAVLAAMTSGFACITGSAGTGKTVVIRELVKLLEALNDVVLVATPTGKAAEVLVSRGIPHATTIHAVLGLRPDDTPALGADPIRSTSLRAKWVILDEATQVDIVLWDHFWAAIEPGTHVLAIGDVGQLPPVGPGAPFETCIASADLLTVRRLHEVRRTTGRLTTNAVAIHEGRMPAFDAVPSSAAPVAPFWDTSAMPEHYRQRAQEALGKKATAAHVSYDAIAAWVVDIVAVELPRALPHLDPAREVQVLAPQGPGPLGTLRLNALLRDRLNPAPEGEKDAPWWYRGKAFRARVGDQIIATDTIGDGIRNGAVGEIVRLDGSSRKATVLFAHQRLPVQIPRTELALLTLRYALTVHRMQGSEIPVVVQVVSEAHNPSLLTRRSMYTGATRAQQVSGIVGTEACWTAALANTAQDERRSSLRSRLEVALRGG
jgi:RecD/TraA family predicted helicase